MGAADRARGGSPAGLELASANGSTARVKGESGAESAARVRAAVHAIGSGGARAGRRERRERASGEASTHLEPGQAGVSPLGPRRRSLRRAVARRAGGARIGHAKDSPEPGRVLAVLLHHGWQQLARDGLRSLASSTLHLGLHCSAAFSLHLPATAPP